MRSARGRAVAMVLVVLALLAGGGGAFFFLRGGRLGKSKQPAESSFQLELTDMVVNLADKSRSHYLTVSLTLVITGEEPEKRVTEKDAQIRDAVLMVMTKHIYADLLSAKGKETLKAELAKAVSGVLAEQNLKATEVLFTNFVME